MKKVFFVILFTIFIGFYDVNASTYNYNYIDLCDNCDVDSIVNNIMSDSTFTSFKNSSAWGSNKSIDKLQIGVVDSRFLLLQNQSLPSNAKYFALSSGNSQKNMTFASDSIRLLDSLGSYPLILYDENFNVVYQKQSTTPNAYLYYSSGSSTDFVNGLIYCGGSGSRDLKTRDSSLEINFLVDNVNFKNLVPVNVGSTFLDYNCNLCNLHNDYVVFKKSQTGGDTPGGNEEPGSQTGGDTPAVDIPVFTGELNRIDEICHYILGDDIPSKFSFVYLVFDYLILLFMLLTFVFPFVLVVKMVRSWL